MDACGNDQSVVNRVLRGIGALLDMQYPGIIRSVYLYGSQVFGNIHPASDIDLLIVIGPAPLGTAERLGAFIWGCSVLSPVPIDATVVDEVDMIDFGAALLSTEAVLVGGTELRSSLTYPPPDLVTATMLHTAFSFVSARCPSRGQIALPLTPVEAEDQWLGFGRSSPSLNGGRPQLNVKVLGTFVLRIVQGVLAAKTGRLIHRKGDALADVFQEHAGGEWSDYVRSVMRLYHPEWQQAVRTEENDTFLRGLCAGAYRFAEWFLTIYRSFLVSELRHPDGARRRLARQNLVRLPFPTTLGVA